MVAVGKHRFLDSIQKYLQFQSIHLTLTCNSEANTRYKMSRYTCYLYVGNHKYCHSVYASSFHRYNMYTHVMLWERKAEKSSICSGDDHDDDDEITAYANSGLIFHIFHHELALHFLLFICNTFDMMLCAYR